MGDTIDCMSDSPYGVTPGGTWPTQGPPQAPPPVWPAPTPKQSRTPVIISLVIAVIAIAVAIGAWFRPAPEAPPPVDAAPQYSDQEISDAEKAVCAAYNKMVQSVSGAGGQSSDDPTTQQIYAVNIRVATHVASDYLLRQLAENPASPTRLTANVRELAILYNDVVLAQLANAPRSALDPLYSKVDAADAKVVEACK